MTAYELAQYYSSLLIVQYNDKDKARETIELFASMLLAENLTFEIRDGFNIDSSLGSLAVGAQIDIVDKYIGVGRDYNGTLLTDAEMITAMKLKIIQTM